MNSIKIVLIGALAAATVAVALPTPPPPEPQTVNCASKADRESPDFAARWDAIKKLDAPTIAKGD